jgi:splicing factor U2AF subunit
MTENMIREFLGNAMLQVGLNTMPGNPITACRVSGKFAFIELRTPEEAANALNLNNIPYLGAQLRVGRPSKWNGMDKPHGNWEDILAKYMSGELKLPLTESHEVPQMAAPVKMPSTRCLEVRHVLTIEELQDDQEYQDILEDTREECSQFGALESIIIPRAHEPGATMIFLKYATPEDAGKAMQGLAGRTFDGRQVQVDYFDEEKFERKQFTES